MLLVVIYSVDSFPVVKVSTPLKAQYHINKTANLSKKPFLKSCFFPYLLKYESIFLFFLLFRPNNCDVMGKIP